VPSIELDITKLVAGGDGIGREVSGRVVFVSGALPGERVLVDITEQKKDFARGELLQVLTSAPERVAPPCPFVAEGCGGCDWQHVDPAAQRGLKVGIVADALRRIGRLGEVEVGEGPTLSPSGYRTTVRGVITSGSFGFRRRGTHAAIAVDPCLVAHPALADLISAADFGDATEVTLRVGARTGERLALLAPTAVGATLPGDVLVVGADQLAAGKRAWYHEAVAGRRFRVSAKSFFQASAEGADALVAQVRESAGDALGSGTLVDLYAGVGLFAGILGEGMQVIAVEQSPSAVADAKINLADRDARIVKSDVAHWRGSTADLVIADPPRDGLGGVGARQVAATGARTVVLISCDPASLGRDARLLASSGYAFDGATLVDLFPQTTHVEVVSRFIRTTP
jgi:23S rRNA (uracil1939-C5)-methyltransferase